MSVDSDHRPETPLPEAGHDPGDPNQPMSEDMDTPTPPAANPSLDMDNLESRVDVMSDDSDLSDIDEAQFEDFDPANVAIDDRPAIAVDESNVGLIGVHKRKRAEGTNGEEAGKKKRREGKRAKAKKSRKEKDDDDDFSGGEEIEGKRQRKKKAVGEKKERAKPRKPSPENEENLTPEERRRRALDRAMDEALKNPNRRRHKIDGLEQETSTDEHLEHLRRRMVNAARSDNDARKEGRIATEKLKLLPEVIGSLNRSTFQNSIVDPESGIIEAVKFFLEPLSDGSLPAYNVQRDLFTALTRLPINQETLLQSGIGKVTLFYSKSKRPETGIKRTAERLLGEWSRPILKRSDDYKNKKREKADYDPAKLPIRASQQILSQTADEIRESALAPIRNTNRARIEGGPVSYDVVPENIRTKSNKTNAKRMGASVDDYFRKLQARQAARIGGGNR